MSYYGILDCYSNDAFDLCIQNLVIEDRIGVNVRLWDWIFGGSRNCPFGIPFLSETVFAFYHRVTIGT